MLKASNQDRPKLKLIPGGRRYEISVGKTKVVAAPKNTPPFPVEAMVFEEDTFLVMSADPTPSDVKVSMMRIMTGLIEARPRVPGTLVLQGRSPLRMLAIVHDFNQDPSWKEEWIEGALTKVFEESTSMGLQSLALPLLGTVYGSLEKRRFIELLVHTLREAGHKRLKTLWLVVPSGEASETIRTLRAELEKQNSDFFSPLSS